MKYLRCCWTLVIIGPLLLTGCGGRRDHDQPELGLVTGIVAMEGKPLPGVMVSFGPTSGRSSNGITNKNGRYELEYLFKTKGAKVGSHVVSITTYHEDEDSPQSLAAKETIPAEYNLKTTLKADVKPGKNEINFELKSKL